MLAALGACRAAHGPTVPDPPDPYSQSTRPSLDDPATDLAIVWINNGCSGVLVGRKSIVTAGHCVTPVHSDVVFSHDRAATTYYTGDVAEAVRMPAWDGPGTAGSLGTTGVNDVQLLRLTTAVPASLMIDGSPAPLTPVSIGYTAAPVPCTDCTRHVGFGSIVYRKDNHKKKSVVSSIDTVTGSKFEYGNRSGGVYRGTCHGDSGGAGFMTFHGVEKLVGIVNNGDLTCSSESWDTRADRPDVQNFIKSTLATWGDCTGHDNCGDLVPMNSVIDDNTVGSGTNEFTYSPGNWIARQDTSLGWYLKTAHYTRTTDAAVTLTFSGTQIVAYAMTHTSNGMAAYSIDNGTESVVDLYASNRSAQQAVFTSAKLPDATHTLKIRVTGTKNPSASDYLVNVDKVDISP